MILQLLCSRHISAVSSSEHNAHRMPEILFAAIEMPTPVPQIKIPTSATFRLTA